MPICNNYYVERTKIITITKQIYMHIILIMKFQRLETKLIKFDKQ